MKWFRMALICVLMLSFSSSIGYAKGPLNKDADLVESQIVDNDKKSNKKSDNDPKSVPIVDNDKKSSKKTDSVTKPVVSPTPTPAPTPILKPSGKKITFKDGSYYIGAVKNNKPNGKGKLYNSRKMLICDCEYKAGVLVRGTTYLPNHPEQKSYTGEYKIIAEKAVFSGKGTLVYHDGSKYTGQFLIGKFDG